MVVIVQGKRERERERERENCRQYKTHVYMSDMWIWRNENTFVCQISQIESLQ